VPPDHSVLPASLNLRREKLDPLLRGIASETPGVTTLLGATVDRLLFDDGRIAGVETRDAHGQRQRLSAPLVIGADGRESPVAKLAGLAPQVRPHGRFVYAGYFEGPSPAGAPDGSVWFLDPQWAAAFPTDAGLTLYSCMLTEERLPDFRRDPQRAFRAFLADLPDPPPIAESRMVGPVIGKLRMPNVRRGPIGPGIALVGDAAVTSDPVAGVGCGWAFQAAEWLAEATAPALHASEPLAAGLRRYRQRLRRELHPHDALITGYATGRPMHSIERQIFSSAARDRRLAASFEAMATRSTDPRRLLPALAPQIAASHARRAAGRRSGRRQLELSA
jgi:2-polyprenyl-6-methoxyphenol hydroxylase-like FAD-dependent oxidoreductase